MHHEPNPTIGDWYKNSVGDTFEIIAEDEEDDTLELQYFDGTLEELDRETWESMQAEPIEPPEDWRGSMDVSPEDQGETEIWSETGNWMNTVDQMDDNIQ